MCTQHTQSHNFLCRMDLEWQPVNEYQLSKPIRYCIPVYMASWFESKRQVKSHHEFNICCVFVTLFLYPFSLSPFEIIFYGVKSTGKLINATKSHMERERTCIYVRIVWSSRRGSFLKRFDGATQRQCGCDWFSLWQFLFVWIFLRRYPLKWLEKVAVNRRKSQSSAGDRNQHFGDEYTNPHH